jgi:hypothetical protein
MLVLLIWLAIGGLVIGGLGRLLVPVPIIGAAMDRRHPRRR